MDSEKIKSLRERVLHSGSWTLAGYGFNQGLRFAGNLILTRLLFPEAFGLMAIYSAVNYGVHMLSDVGIGPSIVQKGHGDQQEFLNTAWTVQIVRGLIAWVGLCALAIPMARFYGEPLLAAMLPVVGLTAVIGGFNSTKLFTAQRNLEAAKITKIDIGSATFGLVCTVILAWIWKSVWALVWGNIITCLIQLTLSHTLLHGYSNKLAWDREALKHLRGFGRWVLLSSALTFLSVEGARLIIGALLNMRELALYSLASAMSLMLWQAMQQLAGRVFFPAYSEVYRTNPDGLMNVLYKARLSIILPVWCLAVLFIFFGDKLMDTLYDSRYHGSGAMLQILAAGTLLSCIWGSYVGVLMALGKVAVATLLTAIQVSCQIGSIYVGYHYWGGIGIVFGLAAANWVLYPLNAFVMFKNNLWQPKLDMVMIPASILIVALAWSRFLSSV